VPRIDRHTQVVGWLSFGLIGLWFALAKTVAPVHELTTTAWNALIGWQGSLRMDVTDLLTLPALLIGGWVWQRASDAPVNLRPVGYAALALGLVTTLASDSPPSYVDEGITEICTHEGRYVVFDPVGFHSYDVYISKNGSTWDYLARTDPVYSPPEGTYEDLYPEASLYEGDADATMIHEQAACSGVSDETVLSLNEDSMQIRWIPNERIEVSTDGGETWDVDYTLPHISSDIRDFYHRMKGNAMYHMVEIPSVPVSAVYDDASGNVIFAMGWNGVLVRESRGGVYSWQSIGEDYYVHDLSLREAPEPLLFHGFLLLTIPALVLTTTAAIVRRAGILRRIWLIVGWIGFVVLSLIVPTGSEYWYAVPGLIALPLLLVVALPLTLSALWDAVRNYRGIWQPVLITSLLAIPAYLLPYLMWVTGRTPNYITSGVFALLLMGGVLAGCYQHYAPHLPTPETLDSRKKTKRKPDADETVTE
jgi:hypothetical protein